MLVCDLMNTFVYLPSFMLPTRMLLFLSKQVAATNFNMHLKSCEWSASLRNYETSYLAVIPLYIFTFKVGFFTPMNHRLLVTPKMPFSW